MQASDPETNLKKYIVAKKKKTSKIQKKLNMC